MEKSKVKMSTIDAWRWFEDEQEIREKYWTIQSGDVVIDVGCHVGEYTIPALEAGATVYAVDPSREYTDVMQHFSAPISKLIVVNVALAEDAAGYSTEFQNALVAEVNYKYLHATQGVKYMTLDTLVEQHDLERLDWIKIDVEGAELSVLKGAIKTLTRFHPLLLIEDHTLVYPFVDAQKIAQQCAELVRSLGYEIEVVDYENNGFSAARAFQICTFNR